MGYPMAERLLKAGHSVAIWNRTKSKADPLAKLGGLVKESRSELGDVDVLFTMVEDGLPLISLLSKGLGSRTHQRFCVSPPSRRDLILSTDCLTFRKQICARAERRVEATKVRRA
jgi:hypothetical protein